MTDDAILSLPHLRTLIGLRVRYQDRLWRVVEGLESPPSLVLEAIAPASLVADQHGHPREYAVESRVLPMLSDNRTRLNDALMDLELAD